MILFSFVVVPHLCEMLSFKILTYDTSLSDAERFRGERTLGIPFRQHLSRTPESSEPSDCVGEVINKEMMMMLLRWRCCAVNKLIEFLQQFSVMLWGGMSGGKQFSAYPKYLWVFSSFSSYGVGTEQSGFQSRSILFGKNVLTEGLTLVLIPCESSGNLLGI